MPASMGPGVLVRVAAEILLNRELLGGDWITITVDELTVDPSLIRVPTVSTSTGRWCAHYNVAPWYGCGGRS